MKPVSGATTLGDAILEAFLPQFELGTSGFVNGEPALWKQQASHGDDVTLMGGWGDYKQGWDAVGPHYDWAAARFRESGTKVRVDYLASNVSGDLAYTVGIERSEPLLAGLDKPAPMALRVTHIYRREDGAWKLVHRHADNLLEKMAVDTVLQK